MFVFTSFLFRKFYFSCEDYERDCNSFNVIFSDRNFKQEFRLVMQEISVAVAVTVVVMRENRKIGELRVSATNFENVVHTD